MCIIPHRLLKLKPWPPQQCIIYSALRGGVIVTSFTLWLGRIFKSSGMGRKFRPVLGRAVLWSAVIKNVCMALKYIVFVDKVLGELILPCMTRLQMVRDFLHDVDPTVRHFVTPISDVYGPTKDDPSIEVRNIVATIARHFYIYFLNFVQSCMFFLKPISA